MAKVDSFCPYCACVLVRPPKRAAACPHCGKQIRVRTKQTLFPSHLLTVDQAKAVDWHAHLRSNCGATEGEYRETYEVLSRVFRRPAPPLDVIMSMFDAAMLRGPRRMSQVAFSRARFVAEIGGDPRPWMQQSKRLQLEIEFRPSPVIGGVRVMPSYACCDECKVQANDEYTIEEALQAMPLPFEGCTRNVYGGPYPLCICIYDPIPKPPSEWG